MNLIGKKVTIDNKNIFTNGKKGVISEYNSQINKYQIDFYGGWTGWYLIDDLNIEF